MSHNLNRRYPLAVALEGDQPDGRALVFRQYCQTIRIYYGNASTSIPSTRVNKRGGFDTVYSIYGGYDFHSARDHLISCFSYKFMTYPGKEYHFPKTFRFLTNLPFEKPDIYERNPYWIMRQYDEQRRRDGDEVLNVKNYRVESVGYGYDQWYKVVCD